MPYQRNGIVPDGMPQQPGSDSQIDILKSPVQHVRIEPVEFLIEPSTHRCYTTLKCGSLVYEPAIVELKQPQPLQVPPSRVERPEIQLVTVPRLVALVFPRFWMSAQIRGVTMALPPANSTSSTKRVSAPGSGLQCASRKNQDVPRGGTSGMVLGS